VNGVGRAARRTLALLAVLAAFALAAPAWADEQIKAAPENQYTNPDVTIDQGERLTFKNLDVNEHTVTAVKETDGNPLFDTGLVGTNQEKKVDGSQYLTTGDYDFFCTTHTYMRGVLHVTANGTPVPRPGSAGDHTPADVTVAIVRMKVSKVEKKKKLPVKITVSEAADVKLVAKLGHKTVAKGKADLDQGTDTVKIKLTKAGKKALRHRSSAKIKVTADVTDKAGNKSSDDTKRKLKG